MIGQLTSGERQSALLMLLVLAVVGFAMAVAGRNDPLGGHGALIVLVALAGIFAVISGYYLPAPTEERFEHYYDDPTKAGIILAMGWAVFGLFVGDWVAWLLVYPELTFDAGWSSYGRLRPVHTTAVIFGFGGNALIATSLYVLQRTSRARLPDQLSPWFVLFGYNLFCILAVTGYMMGITQSKEYAEPEWYADIWLVIVWVVYFLIYLRTLARRKEPHIYVANWYYMAFILVVAILHIVNNLAVPVSLGHAKSYSAFSGVQDAMTQWWYGHNAVAFFLTAGFLGMMYYYLPKRANRPIFSYRLSIISFWGITFLYMWAGSHHLHYTALPHWVQTLGHDVLGDAAGAVVGVGGQRAAHAQRRLGQGPRRRDTALHDGGRGVLRAFDLRGIVHGDPLRELPLALYRLDGRPCPCRRARLGGHDHLWRDLRLGALALEAGEHVFSEAGRGSFLARGCRDHHLRLRDVEFRHYPGTDVADLQRERHARLLVRRLARCDASLLHRARDRGLALSHRRRRRLLQYLDDDPHCAAERGRSGLRQPRLGACGYARASAGGVTRMFGLHYRLERKAVGLVLAIIGVTSIGGIVEIAPLFTIHQTVEDAPDMRVYTPLELAGRNIYIREGCYACHSQMIRTLRDEVERYGPYSLAVESKYDHPMLWGSKRTGPDLARVGGKYSDDWHVAHLNNPRAVMPESIMPAYAWLSRTALRTDDLGPQLKAMRAVGVPYTDEMVANAASDAYGQAAPDSAAGGRRDKALRRRRRTYGRSTARPAR